MADKEREIGMREKEIETLLKQLEDAINPDFRAAKSGEIKMALDELEMEVGSRGVEDYYRRLNRTYGETLEESSLPEVDTDKEKLPEEMIIEGEKRVQVFVGVEDMFDRLEAEKEIKTRERLAEEIEKFLDQNEEIILRSDASGVVDLRSFRLRLDNLVPRRKEKEEEKAA